MRNALVQVLARQFCIVEQQMYMAMPVAEFLSKRFSGRNKAEEAPNIIRSIAHFNSVSVGSFWYVWLVAQGFARSQAG